MKNDKSTDQQSAEKAQDIEHDKELGGTKVKNAKKLNLIDESLAKEKDIKSQGRDLINQLLGRTQMANALAQFSNLAATVYLKKVKEDQLYIDLKGCILHDKEGVEIANVGTWEGFCKAIGVSVSKANTDIAEYKKFGQVTVEAMEMAGISYRQRAKLKALPADDLASVISEVQENIGDEQAIVKLVESTIIKHSKEKEALQKQLEETKANNKSKDEYAETLNARINKLDKIVGKNLSPDEKKEHHQKQEKMLMDELTGKEIALTSAINEMSLAIGKVYNFPKCSEELEQMPHKLYERSLKGVVKIADEHGIMFDAGQILGPILHDLINTAPQDENGR